MMQDFSLMRFNSDPSSFASSLSWDLTVSKDVLVLVESAYLCKLQLTATAPDVHFYLGTKAPRHSAGINRLTVDETESAHAST